MKNRGMIGLGVGMALIAALGIHAYRTTHAVPVLIARMTMGEIPEPRRLPLPEVSAWTPDGNRHASRTETHMMDAGVWRQRHGDGRNSDETILAGAPTFGPARIIAPDELYFTAISFGRDSTIYASPNASKDRTFLVAYDIESGKERWRIKTDGPIPAGGVPIILPDGKGGETIYQIGYEEAMAVAPDGHVLWRSATGLKLPESEGSVGLMWGPSYNEKLDIITGVSGKGELVAFDRETGRLLTPAPLKVPGAPSPIHDVDMPPQLTRQLTDGLSRALGYQLADDTIERVLRVVQGDGINIANYHSVDPETGRLWLSATAPDDADGKLDGLSEYGALYGIDIARDETNGTLGLSIGCAASFNGGSASTPGLRADGKRIYIADGEGNLLAYDSDCRKLWSADAGAQIVASPSVALDNDEVYVITAVSLLKFLDEDDSARLAWEADFNMYDASFPLAQKNLLTAAIAANGIYAQAGLGVTTRPAAERPGFLPLRRGGARLDRETGKVLWYAENTGDSVAVTELAPNGALVIPQSPVRSVLAGLAFHGKEGELTGGIAVFMPDRPELLARDATCSAALMARKGEEAENREAAESFRAQARALMRQAANALPPSAARLKETESPATLAALCEAMKENWLKAE